MASYAAIASNPKGDRGDASNPKAEALKADASKPVASSSPQTGEDISADIAGWIEAMAQVTDVPENLRRLVESLRKEMESPGGVAGFRGGLVGGSGSGSGAAGAAGAGAAATRSFGGKAAPANAWRGRFGGPAQTPFDTRAGASPSQPRPQRGSEGWTKAGTGSGPGTSPNPSPDAWSKPQPTPLTQARPVGRYQSRFKPTGNIEDKILNTVIGNKLNSFTPLTYNDTRDFIYQIMDSGETEFVKDFIEKVFTKAILEDLYCALFAKLIAEIAHKYPVIYEEMDKYHGEFLKIFDDVKEDTETDYVVLVKQKQYRMGYGQFIAELAGLDALEKPQLITMVDKITEKVWALTAEENKTKTVEEFVDCLTRLTSGLRERSPAFFRGVKGEILKVMGEKIGILLSKTDSRPSLSKKAGFGLMDLKEILGV